MIAWQLLVLEKKKHLNCYWKQTGLLTDTTAYREPLNENANETACGHELN